MLWWVTWKYNMPTGEMHADELQYLYFLLLTQRQWQRYSHTKLKSPCSKLAGFELAFHFSFPCCWRASYSVGRCSDPEGYVHKDSLSFMQKGDFDIQTAFSSWRKGCLQLWGLKNSHGQRSDPNSQRVNSFCGCDMFLLKGQTLPNELKDVTLCLWLPGYI